MAVVAVEVEAGLVDDGRQADRGLVGLGPVADDVVELEHSGLVCRRGDIELTVCAQHHFGPVRQGDRRPDRERDRRSRIGRIDDLGDRQRIAIGVGVVAQDIHGCGAAGRGGQQEIVIGLRGRIGRDHRDGRDRRGAVEALRIRESEGERAVALCGHTGRVAVGDAAHQRVQIALVERAGGWCDRKARGGCEDNLGAGPRGKGHCAGRRRIRREALPADGDDLVRAVRNAAERDGKTRQIVLSRIERVGVDVGYGDRRVALGKGRGEVHARLRAVAGGGVEVDRGRQVERGRIAERAAAIIVAGLRSARHITGRTCGGAELEQAVAIVIGPEYATCIVGEHGSDHTGRASGGAHDLGDARGGIEADQHTRIGCHGIHPTVHRIEGHVGDGVVGRRVDPAQRERAHDLACGHIDSVDCCAERAPYIEQSIRSEIADFVAVRQDGEACDRPEIFDRTVGAYADQFARVPRDSVDELVGRVEADGVVGHAVRGISAIIKGAADKVDTAKLGRVGARSVSLVERSITLEARLGRDIDGRHDRIAVGCAVTGDNRHRAVAHRERGRIVAIGEALDQGIEIGGRDVAAALCSDGQRARI